MGENDFNWSIIGWSGLNTKHAGSKYANTQLRTSGSAKSVFRGVSAERGQVLSVFSEIGIGDLSGK